MKQREYIFSSEGNHILGLQLNLLELVQAHVYSLHVSHEPGCDRSDSLSVCDATGVPVAVGPRHSLVEDLDRLQELLQLGRVNKA